MSAQGEEKKPEAVRVECSSEEDLFFHYLHALDGKGVFVHNGRWGIRRVDHQCVRARLCVHMWGTAGFLEMQSKQKLMVDFASYCTVLIRTLGQCIKEPQRCAIMSRVERARECEHDC